MIQSEALVDTGIPVDKSLPHRIPTLVYHKIDPRFEYSITRITPSRFTRHLDRLVELGYTTVRLSDVVEAVRQGRPLPDRTVALTFDDGFESVYTYALPLLQERGLVATVFMVVDYIGREDGWDVNIGWRRFQHLTWEQLRHLRDAGFEIGSHTLNHPDLTRLSPQQIRYELETSRCRLQDKLNVPVDVLSCPFGKYSPLVSELSAEAGYSGVVAVRKPQVSRSSDGVVTLVAECVYRTTSLKSLQDRLECRDRSRFMCAVNRGIGWCAGRTPVVKGPPAYPLS